MKRRLVALGFAVPTMVVGSPVAWGFSELLYQDFLKDTGRACLVGGTIAGLTATASPATVAAVLPTAIAVPGSMISTLLVSCGIGAAVALSYYSAAWTYNTFFAEPKYPLLYPPMPKPTD